MEGEETGILRVGLEVGGTLRFRRILVEIPTHDIIGSTVVGRDLLVTIHLDGSLGIGGVVVPGDERQDFIIGSRKLHLCSILILMDAIHHMSFRFHRHHMDKGTVGRMEVESVYGGLLINGLQIHTMVYRERIRISLRDIITVGILPSEEMVAEILGRRQRHLRTFIKDGAIGTDRHGAGFRRGITDMERI